MPKEPRKPNKRIERLKNSGFLDRLGKPKPKRVHLPEEIINKAHSTGKDTGKRILSTAGSALKSKITAGVNAEGHFFLQNKAMIPRLKREIASIATRTLMGEITQSARHSPEYRIHWLNGNRANLLRERDQTKSHLNMLENALRTAIEKSERIEANEIRRSIAESSIRQHVTEKMIDVLVAETERIERELEEMD